jgi:hypothetical protein
VPRSRDGHLPSSQPFPASFRPRPLGDGKPWLGYCDVRICAVPCGIRPKPLVVLVR